MPSLQRNLTQSPTRLMDRHTLTSARSLDKATAVFALFLESAPPGSQGTKLRLIRGLLSWSSQGPTCLLHTALAGLRQEGTDIRRLFRYHPYWISPHQATNKARLRGQTLEVRHQVVGRPAYKILINVDMHFISCAKAPKFLVSKIFQTWVPQRLKGYSQHLSTGNSRCDLV